MYLLNSSYQFKRYKKFISFYYLNLINGKFQWTGWTIMAKYKQILCLPSSEVSYTIRERESWWYTSQSMNYRKSYLLPEIHVPLKPRCENCPVTNSSNVNGFWALAAATSVTHTNQTCFFVANNYKFTVLFFTIELIYFY